MPISSDRLVKGNAYTDGAPRGGWLVASFIDASFGIRCRAGKQIAVGGDKADFELKMRRHFSGDKEERPFPYNKTATSFSMLIGSGRFEIFFCSSNDWDHVTLDRDGDYALWAPGVGHLWIAPEASTIFSVRVPGVPGDQEQTPLADIPVELKRYFPDTALDLA